MHFKWNSSLTRWLAPSIAALLATTSLHAIPRASCDPKPDVCCEEPKPGPFAFAYPMDMNLACPLDFFVHGEGLAFQAKQDGMEFALYNATTVSTGTPMTNGKVIGFSSNTNDWGYNPGFRFGLGFFLDHDAWVIDFNWTWLNITEYKTQNTGATGARMHPQWLLGTSTLNAQVGNAASARWDATYDMVDASLAKAFHVSRYLVMTPFFGLRGGWVDQSFSVDYQGSGAGNRTINRCENNFWGIGGRAGMKSDWILGKGWCLFSNLSSSMLYGKFEIEQRGTIPSGDGEDLDYDFFQNIPNFEMALGIGWGKHFSKHRYYFGVKAAYEFIQWFDMFQLNKFYSGNPSYVIDAVRGNLTMNGFSLKIQLDI